MGGPGACGTAAVVPSGGGGEARGGGDALCIFRDLERETEPEAVVVTEVDGAMLDVPVGVGDGLGMTGEGEMDRSEQAFCITGDAALLGPVGDGLPMTGGGEMDLSEQVRSGDIERESLVSVLVVDLGLPLSGTKPMDLFKSSLTRPTL